MPIKVVCQKCSKEFYVKPAIIKLGKGKFCSKECMYAVRKGRPIKQFFKSVTRYSLKCKQCGKTFKLLKSQTKRGRGKFCSKECCNNFKIGKKTNYAFTKGNIPWNKDLKGIHLSPDTEFKKGQCSGENHPMWKGGIKQSHGYVLLHRPNHPNCNSQGYVKRSHLVIEESLGIKIKHGEIVHHINEIKDDDRIENLKIFTRSEHMKHHAPSRNRKVKT